MPDCANAETQIYDIHLLSVEHSNTVPPTYIYIKDRDFWYYKATKSQGILCEVRRSRNINTPAPNLLLTHTNPHF